MKHILRVAPLLALLAVTAACDAPPPGADAASGAAPAMPPSAQVDSAESIEALLHRFRADLPAAPTALSGGGASRAELVERFAHALEQNDTAAFEALTLSRAEFAYLYYPSSPMAHPPYELPPALMWARLQGANRKGVLRALRSYGGRPLGLAGDHCPAEAPAVEGQNRLWAGCVLRIRGAQDAHEVRLFGAILERDGRFKFVSLANDL